jgi:nitrate reductase assembly molybdenum cofactor insertion protein NarJ
MRNLLRENGVNESVELPDHLTHILPLLDRLEHHEKVQLNDKYLKPALTKMLAAFEDKQTAYAHVLRACDAMLLHSKAMTPAEVTHG